MYACVHMYENACRRPEEGGRFHEAGTKDRLCGCQEPNLGPLQKQRELLALIATVPRCTHFLVFIPCLLFPSRKMWNKIMAVAIHNFFLILCEQHLVLLSKAHFSLCFQNNSRIIHLILCVLGTFIKSLH